MLVWGNYCNVVGGAAPVNIYYSTDSGHTVKIAYAFGQDPDRHCQLTRKSYNPRFRHLSTEDSCPLIWSSSVRTICSTAARIRGSTSPAQR